MATDLVAHLRSLPDDWDSWLVYADQLTERGDERGQLLVLEQRGNVGDRELVQLQADDWIATWGEYLGSDDAGTYKWIRGLAPLADPPTPPDLLPVFARPISQLIALFDLEDRSPPDLSPIFELHRDQVFEATLAWINLAFDGVPLPDANHRTIHQAEAADNYESYNRSRDHLGRWQELPDAHLLANQFALPHLDEQGVRYYVPAIMSFALRHPGSGHLILDSLEYSLQPSGDDLRTHQQGKLVLLDRAQRAAIYAYTLVARELVASAAWRRVYEAERTGERLDWFELFSPR